MGNLISSSSGKGGGGGWGGGEGFSYGNAMIPFICLDKNSTELLLCSFSYNYVVAGPGTCLQLCCCGPWNTFTSLM
jgi:hypothetical protein